MVRHVIVVGAGPGGLSVAINLAGQGLKVTVVEKDSVPSGWMKGLTLGERGEYALDTGPSILQLPGVLERIFLRAGKRIEDYVRLVPVDPNTRVHFWDGGRTWTPLKAPTLRFKPWQTLYHGEREHRGGLPHASVRQGSAAAVA